MSLQRNAEGMAFPDDFTVISDDCLMGCVTGGPFSEADWADDDPSGEAAWGDGPSEGGVDPDWDAYWTRKEAEGFEVETASYEASQ